MLSEKQIQQQIIQYLQYQENAGKIVFIRNNSFAGKIQRRNGSEGYVCNRKAGSPDILIFLPRGLDTTGITLHCEIKTETGKQIPSQLLYQQAIEKLGHRYIIVRSLDELEEELNFYL